MYPALSVHRALEGLTARRGIPLDVVYMGHPKGVEARLVARAGIPFRPVAGGQIRGQGIFRRGWNALRVLWGWGQAWASMRSFRPQVVFVTGGWVTAPVVLAAWTARVPVVIYLPDVTPGMAVRRLQRFARRVAVTVPEAAGYFPGKGVVTGYPVREEVVRARREPARARWGIPLDAKVLLVFGGSRGARSLNRALVAHVNALTRLAHVIHVTGSLDHAWVRAAWAELPQEVRSRYHVHEYLHEEMADALAAADLVVSRAGASVLGEFPARGLPAVLVPYPHAGRHQEANARYLADRGAAVMVADENVARDLGATVTELLTDEERLAAMAEAARGLYRPDAARRIAEVLLREAERISGV